MTIGLIISVIRKNDTETYIYDVDKPHAVSEIVDSIGNSLISINQQSISYNPFGKTASIAQGIYNYTITYGIDAQRKKTVLKESNIVTETRIYSGLYEKQTTASATKEFHYIPTPCGTVAVNIRENNVGITYFLLKDYLSSIIMVVDNQGVTIEEHSYDPWGNHRDPITWTLTNFTTNLSVNRGYTGHEMLPTFQLINMNGRMYDPIIGRMLAPDNYIANPLNAQDYNRYSYARSNPLKYTDPTGQWIHIVVGAAVGGIMNLIMNAGNLDKGWKGVGQCPLARAR